MLGQAPASQQFMGHHPSPQPEHEQHNGMITTQPQCMSMPQQQPQTPQFPGNMNVMNAGPTPSGHPGMQSMSGGGPTPMDSAQLIGPTPSPKQHFTQDWMDGGYNFPRQFDSGIGSGAVSEYSVHSGVSSYRHDLVYGSETRSMASSSMDDITQQLQNIIYDNSYADPGPSEPFGQTLTNAITGMENMCVPPDLQPFFDGTPQRPSADPFQPQVSHMGMGPGGPPSQPPPSWHMEDQSMNTMPPSVPSSNYDMMTPLKSPMSVEPPSEASVMAPCPPGPGPPPPQPMGDYMYSSSPGVPPMGRPPTLPEQKVAPPHIPPKPPVQVFGPPTSSSAVRSPEEESALLDGALPEIIKWLDDTDMHVVQKSASLIKRMSMANSNRSGYNRSLLNSDHLIFAIFRAISRVENEPHEIRDTIMLTLLRILYNFTHHEEATSKIYHGNLLQHLVRYTRVYAHNTKIMFILMPILSNFVNHRPEYITTLRQTGFIPNAVPFLNSSDGKFLSVLVDCLYSITKGHTESKRVFMERGGVGYLVQILRIQTAQDRHTMRLVQKVMDFLKDLSSLADIRSEMVENDAITALHLHLRNPIPKLASLSLTIIRNISDQPKLRDENMDVSALLGDLIQILALPQNLPPRHALEVISSATGILCNLTCNSPKNKVFVCQTRPAPGSANGGGPGPAPPPPQEAQDKTGYRVMLDIARGTFQDRRFDVCELALSTLRNLSWGHSEQGTVCSFLVHSGCLMWLCDVLDFAQKPLPPALSVHVPPARELWPLIKVSLCIIKLLAGADVNAKSLLSAASNINNNMRPLRGIERLVRTFVTASMDIEKDQTGQYMYEGKVSMMFIKKTSQEALEILAEEPENQGLIYQMCPMALSQLHPQQ